MTATFQHLAGRPVIVGSGLAGMVTALLAREPVVLMTRAGLGEETSSAWAQGGIAAALGPDDDSGLHLADTLAAGDGLCDAEAAASILADAGEAIAVLERFGVSFDRDAQGRLCFGLEAAHARRRILHVKGDGSGAAIVRALTERIARTPSIAVLEGVEARRLILTGGRLSGVLCATPEGAALLATGRVVLATGGLGGLYDATTNPAGNYGQGIALAARAGAELADMEFVQFHPTALDSPRRPLALISEAVRGEGAILIDETNERFLRHAPGAELAPRDVVARAVAGRIARGGRVFIDARQALGAGFAGRFPAVEALCRQAGLDPAREPIPVRPAAHYHMGGVATDRRGRSSVDGLWVIGEAACTGLHGANRLASNSLLEAVVMGMRAARDITEAKLEPAGVPCGIDLPSPADLSVARALASRHLGVLRGGDGLRAAIAGLLPHVERDGATADPALVALLIAVFAWLRDESRGAHAREDFPARQDAAHSGRMTLAEALATARMIASSPLARSA